MDKSKCIPVKNTRDFLNHIIKGYHPMYKWLYRGVTRTSYTLHPVIGRSEAPKFKKAKIKRPYSRKKEEKLLSVFKEKEEKLLSEFKRQSFAYTGRSPIGDMEWLCLARHYGLATRLLDWTTNPLVALFFAANKEIDDEEGFAVYQYKPGDNKWKTVIERINMIQEHISSLNGSSDKETSFEEIPVAMMSIDDIQNHDESFVFHPTFLDERLIRQSSVFVSCHEPWEDFADDLDQEIVRFEFPYRARKGVRQRLAIFGVTPSFIRPGLDGLCEELNDIYVHYERKFPRISLANVCIEKLR